MPTNPLSRNHPSALTGTLSTPNGAVVVGFGKRPITILLTENSIQMLDSVTNELMQQTEFTMVREESAPPPSLPAQMPHV